MRNSGMQNSGTFSSGRENLLKKKAGLRLTTQNYDHLSRILLFSHSRGWQLCWNQSQQLCGQFGDSRENSGFGNTPLGLMITCLTWMRRISFMFFAPLGTRGSSGPRCRNIPGVGITVTTRLSSARSAFWPVVLWKTGRSSLRVRF